MKTAVITGAGSGIGRAFAGMLSEQGYRCVLVGRRRDVLEELASGLSHPEIFCADLCDEQNCRALYDRWQDADMVINSAGIGVAGEFLSTDMEKELMMLDVNIRALHILTRLYADSFVKRGSGTLVNIASSAAFFPGPLFASYYATKSYVYRLTTSVHDELKRINPDIRVSVVCPGPVDTGFNQKAGVNAGRGAVTADFVAQKTLKQLGKRVIVPGFGIRCTVLASKILPERIMSAVNYRLQKNKQVR